MSVPFTWVLREARAIALSHPTERVVAGGPAVRLMPDYVAEWAELEAIAPSDPLRRANPDASRSTVGCDRACGFCGVMKIEGPFRELDDWRPAPVMCDSNFLACSDAHFDRAIDRLKPLPTVDFNQGLDARRLTARRAERLAELNVRPRLAWDRVADEDALFQGIAMLEGAGFKLRASSPESVATANLRVYCLVGYHDSPEDATYRLETLRQERLCGFAMRYQPLDALERNTYVGPNWTERLLKDFCRYWNRQRWLGGLSFEDYRAGWHDERQEVLQYAER